MPLLSQRSLVPSALSQVSYLNEEPYVPLGSFATVIVPGAFSRPWNTLVPRLGSACQSTPEAAGAAGATADRAACWARKGRVRARAAAPAAITHLVRRIGSPPVSAIRTNGSQPILTTGSRQMSRPKPRRAHLSEPAGEGWSGWRDSNPRPRRPERRA